MRKKLLLRQCPLVQVLCALETHTLTLLPTLQAVNHNMAFKDTADRNAVPSSTKCCLKLLKTVKGYRYLATLQSIIQLL